MIFALNEQAQGPITFEQAMDLMLPGDTFKLYFQKEATKYGFTIFEPGKAYEGSEVLPDGRIRIQHEDVFLRGAITILTKEEFLEELFQKHLTL